MVRAIQWDVISERAVGADETTAVLATTTTLRAAVKAELGRLGHPLVHVGKSTLGLDAAVSYVDCTEHVACKERWRVRVESKPEARIIVEHTGESSGIQREVRGSTPAARSRARDMVEPRPPVQAIAAALEAGVDASRMPTPETLRGQRKAVLKKDAADVSCKHAAGEQCGAGVVDSALVNCGMGSSQ